MQNIIGKHMLELESDIMTPEILWAFGRVGDVQVSPDNTKILYGVSYYSVEEDKSNRELFVMDLDGSNKKQLTTTAAGEYAAQAGITLALEALNRFECYLCNTMEQLQRLVKASDHPNVKVEVLIPDFAVVPEHMHTLAKSKPFVIAQNLDSRPL